MAVIFWTTLGIIIYAYLGYWALCIAASFVLGRKEKREEGFIPSVTLIIPCYNEESVIRAKIENIISLDYPKEKLQVIIASESNDSTNSIIKEFSGANIQLLEFKQRKGKSSLLYNSVPEAAGEILVFSDANALYKKDALKRVSENFFDEKVGAVIGSLRISNAEDSAISLGEHIYKGYERMLRQANSSMGSVLNADGSIFALRKSLYLPLSENRGDDFELTLKVLLCGYRCVFDPRAVSYEKASVSASQEVSRKIRMVSWFLKSTLLIMKEALKKMRFELIFQLISHKLLRWFTPYLLLLLFASSWIIADRGIVYKAVFLTQVLFYSTAALGVYISEYKKKKPPFILGAAAYFVVFNYAFLIGTMQGIFSPEKFSTWEKTRE